MNIKSQISVKKSQIIAYKKSRKKVKEILYQEIRLIEGESPLIQNQKDLPWSLSISPILLIRHPYNQKEKVF